MAEGSWTFSTGNRHRPVVYSWEYIFMYAPWKYLHFFPPLLISRFSYSHDPLQSLSMNWTDRHTYRQCLWHPLVMHHAFFFSKTLAWLRASGRHETLTPLLHSIRYLNDGLAFGFFNGMSTLFAYLMPNPSIKKNSSDAIYLIAERLRRSIYIPKGMSPTVNAKNATGVRTCFLRWRDPVR